MVYGMPHQTRRKKYYPKSCSDEMSFEECEMAILREAIQEGDREANDKLVNTPDTRDMIKIVEQFIYENKLVCYGGTAINNILPKKDQFYDLTKEVPDYDFFSKSALEHATQLADIFYKQGYTNIEAKSGVHYGTFKVFVNFIPIADITQIPETVFDAISDEAVVVDKILYCPPNYLRMAMFLELSRPKGDTSRWEKVLARLNLLNKHYPLLPEGCAELSFQRQSMRDSEKSEDIYFIARDVLMEEGVVFFGGYAASIYSKYMPPDQQHVIKKTPDFDVLATDPSRVAKKVSKALVSSGYEDVTLIRHRPMGEILPEHIEVRVADKPIAFIYKPLSCHSYNTIRIDDQPINVATIDTLLSFYLAFIYSGKEYYDRDRILCIADFLFRVMRKNRLAQKGLLKRFSMKCYGKAETLETMRSKKSRMFNLLKTKRGTAEYDEWFLKYDPARKKGIERAVKTRRINKASSPTSTKPDKTAIITSLESEESSEYDEEEYDENGSEDVDRDVSEDESKSNSKSKSRTKQSTKSRDSQRRNTSQTNKRVYHKTKHDPPKSGAVKWLNFFLK